MEITVVTILVGEVTLVVEVVLSIVVTMLVVGVVLSMGGGRMMRTLRCTMR